GLDPSSETRLETARLRAGEPWFPAGFAALQEIQAGNSTDENWTAVDPFLFGRWDDEARAMQEFTDSRRNPEAAAAFGGPGAFDPEATRAALAGLGVPVLLLAGQVDLNTPPPAATAYAELFPRAELVVLPGVGHWPWLDDTAAFVAAVTAFLDRTA
ncbi:alpha/beta fold hydrolase, partial [Nonomuraea sp. NPDC004297]